MLRQIFDKALVTIFDIRHLAYIYLAFSLSAAVIGLSLYNNHHEGRGHGSSTPQATNHRATLIVANHDKTQIGQMSFSNAHVPENPNQKVYENIFSFAQMSDRAHFRRGGLIIDFGERSRYKYTLGNGWESGFLNDVVVNGRSYSNIHHGTSWIVFDSLPDETGEGTIIIRAKNQNQHSAHVLLNGKWIGQMVFNKEEPSETAIDFDDDLLPGQNEIRIHCGNRYSAQTDEATCISLDYIKIAMRMSGEPKSSDSPQSERLSPLSRLPDTLELLEGDSVTYNIPLPENAYILLDEVHQAVGEAANLEVLVSVDGRESQTVENIELRAGAPTNNIEIPLNEFRGAVAVSFRAVVGDVALKNPRIAVLRPTLPPYPVIPKATNFILVVIDTLRADRLRLYNEQSRVTAPVIDRIGRQSSVFRRASAQASWTKPSVTSLLTGLFPGSHRVQKHDSKVPEDVSLASEHFHRLGLTTAGFIANGYISEEFGFKRGWDHWQAYSGRESPTTARQIFSDAADWLKKNGRQNPFFLYVHTVDPHAPYMPPSNFWRPYDSGFYKGVIRPRDTAELLKQIRASNVIISPRDQERLEALYDGEISYHDRQLALLLNAFFKLGLTEDTLLVITADHGEEFFEHGGVGHSHSLFEELVNVPLIVRLPGANQNTGHSFSSEAQLVDVFPTACEILGVKCPKEVQGQSLLPLIKGQPWDGYPRASFAMLPDQGLNSVRMGEFKAIYHHLSPAQYNLVDDCTETTDRSDDSVIAKAMLRDALGLHLSRFSRASLNRNKQPADKVELSAETKRQLKLLGYIGD